MELSYSLHLGNDKNKSIKARQEAKNTPSGTTSKNNNAIQINSRKKRTRYTYDIQKFVNESHL